MWPEIHDGCLKVEEKEDGVFLLVVVEGGFYLGVGE